MTARSVTPPTREQTEATIARILEAHKTPAPSRFAFRSSAERATDAPPSWIIKDHWPACSLVLEIGAPGDGKSFSVIDKCAGVALGVERWNGKRVKRGRVAYVCAEGGGGFRNRERAYELARLSGQSLPATHWQVLTATPNLYASEADRAGLIAALDALRGVDVIVMDTVAATSAGANENSSEMTAVLAFYSLLIKRYGCTVVAIHHVGKDPSKGARGFSGILAAADAEIVTASDSKGLRTVTVTKMKDGPEGGTHHFRLDVIEVDKDEDGEPITSCVVTLQDSAEVKKAKALAASKAAVEQFAEFQPDIDAIYRDFPDGAPGDASKRLRDRFNSLVRARYAERTGDTTALVATEGAGRRIGKAIAAFRVGLLRPGEFETPAEAK